MGSLVLAAADATRVPAGDALAVDRERFSAHVTAALRGCPGVTLRVEEVRALPPPPGLAVVATGPLTSDALAADIAALAGAGLHFYDAIAPIVAADSVDMDVAYARSRWGKGSGAGASSPGGGRRRRGRPAARPPPSPPALPRGW